MARISYAVTRYPPDLAYGLRTQYRSPTGVNREDQAMSEPRAKTPEEIRDDFMDTCRALVDYWADPGIDRATCHERLSGLLHSLLCIFDGVNTGLPAFDITASPHPGDKEFHRSEGENWIEPGTVINAGGYLHEILYKQGTWAERP